MSDLNDETIIRESPLELTDDIEVGSDYFGVNKVNYNTSHQDCLWLFQQSENQLFNLCSEILGITLKISVLPEPEEIDEFRQNLLESIERLKVLATEANYPVAVIDKTCCIFAIVIDEMIHYTSWGENVAWGNKTLLSELFSMKKNGGELFFVLADKAMRQPKKLIDFIELIYLFLNIGFKGKYRFSEKSHLKEYLKKIQLIIERYRQSVSFNSRLTHEKIAVRRPSKKNWYLFISLCSLTFIVLSFGFMTLIYNTTIDNRTLEWKLLPLFTKEHTIGLKQVDTVYLSKDEDFIEESFINSGNGNSKAADLNWFVELKGFSNRKSAYLFVNQLSASKYKPFIFHDTVKFYVRIRASSLSNAKNILAWYKDNDGITGKIIKFSDARGESVREK